VARLYTELREVSATLNAKRNARSAVGERIRRSVDPTEKETSLEEAKELKKEVIDLEAKLAHLDDQLLTLALAIPNDTHSSSPLGPESAAVVLSTHGPSPIPASPSRDHVSICSALGLIDLEAGATVTGSAWYYLLNEGALLETALTNFALSVAIKHGFSFVTTPDVVRSDIAQRCGFQPRDHDSDPPVTQMYHINNQATPSSRHPELVLCGTAEIPLAGLFANKVLPPKSLPLRTVGLGKSFRAEAGARGADTRGLYRVHQFTKLELFVVTEEEQSEDAMEQMRQVQVEICDALGFPFRLTSISI
jgi:seryl-tRNA synthetase